MGSAEPAGERHRNGGRHRAAAIPLSRLPAPGACPGSRAAFAAHLAGGGLVRWTVGGGLDPHRPCDRGRGHPQLLSRGDAGALEPSLSARW